MEIGNGFNPSREDHSALSQSPRVTHRRTQKEAPAIGSDRDRGFKKGGRKGGVLSLPTAGENYIVPSLSGLIGGNGCVTTAS
jgi:hypothetical protein